MIGAKTPITQSTASLSSTGSDGSGADIVFDEYDERPFVKDLLLEHSSDIDSVQTAIQTHPLYDSSRYDDIWILRFVLSHKNNVDAASRAAMATMEFREAHNLNEKDLRGKIKHLDGVPSSEYGLPYGEKIDLCVEKDACLTTLPDENRGLVMYVRLSNLHMNKLNQTMTQEDAKNMTIYSNEAIYQVLDGITRKTGRLTKLMKAVDLDGMSLKTMNRGWISKDSKASKELDNYFPQLLGCLLILDPPRWISVIDKFARPLMPKRVAEKIVFLPTSDKEKAQKSFGRFVSKENFPERYGGENKEWPPLYVGSYFR